ncbi:MAG: TIGR00725 family protein [Candidatus Aminicenantes bacterium]|nr:TIGR00725 family protein [Candidatus Aminicenantes bacterium]
MADVGSNFSLKKRVGIIGGNSPDAQSLRNAERMGELIARNGYILVNGGMKGVMEASARGAKNAGGFVIAITPGKSRDEGNSYSDVVIPTGLGYMRNPMVVLNSDIVVAIDGSYGTLSEIAYCKIYNRTVFGLNTWAIEGVIPLATPETVMDKINGYFKNTNG